jgi:hypothetical protein
VRRSASCDSTSSNRKHRIDGPLRGPRSTRSTRERASNETGQRGGSNPPMAVGLVPSALSTWAYLASPTAIAIRNRVFSSGSATGAWWRHPRAE